MRFTFKIRENFLCSWYINNSKSRGALVWKISDSNSVLSRMLKSHSDQALRWPSKCTSIAGITARKTIQLFASWPSDLRIEELSSFARSGSA